MIKILESGNKLNLDRFRISPLNKLYRQNVKRKSRKKKTEKEDQRKIARTPICLNAINPIDPRGRRMSLHFFTLPFFPVLAPVAAATAFLSSANSFMIWYRSGFLRARSSTSSVVTVERPAWLLKLSRSMATFSTPSTEIRNYSPRFSFYPLKAFVCSLY